MFYPLKHGQKIPDTKQKFDEIAYDADRFDRSRSTTRSTRPPAVKTARSWADRTPPGFEFNLKLCQQLTHKREVRQEDVDVCMANSKIGQYLLVGSRSC